MLNCLESTKQSQNRGQKTTKKRRILSVLPTFFSCRARCLLRPQSGVAQHGEKLPLRALVDGHAGKFAVAVKDEGLRDSLDMELLVHRAASIDEHRGMVARRSQETVHLEGIFDA